VIRNSNYNTDPRSYFRTIASENPLQYNSADSKGTSSQLNKLGLVLAKIKSSALKLSPEARIKTFFSYLSKNYTGLNDYKNIPIA